MVYPIALGVFRMIFSICGIYFEKYFTTEMISTGHITQASLKTILFRKNFRMSEASNKDFSSAEINSIIMNETDVVWKFIWEMSNYIEIPLDLA